MGMFDDIICEYPLPQPENPKGYVSNNYFQTKDFECLLDRYKIDKDGNLLIYQCDKEWVAGNPNSKTLMEKIGYFNETNERWIECKDITQKIRLYNYVHNNDGEYDYSIDYSATIVEGKVTNVTLIKFEAIDNAQRVESHRKFEEHMKKRWAFEKTLMYRCLYGPYNQVIRFSFNYLIKINQSLTKNLWKIERKLTI